jgi:excisionase family DNA binding protein
MEGVKMLNPSEAYKLLFCDYPDVVNVKQMCAMLGGISEKTGYRLLHNGEIKYLAIGRNYRIPKIQVIDYLFVTEQI